LNAAGADIPNAYEHQETIGGNESDDEIDEQDTLVSPFIFSVVLFFIKFCKNNIILFSSNFFFCNFVYMRISHSASGQC
jgi:hypothetical protein